MGVLLQLFQRLAGVVALDNLVGALHSGDAVFASSISPPLLQQVKETKPYTISTFAGNGNYGSSGHNSPAIDASFNEITALAVDAAALALRSAPSRRKSRRIPGARDDNSMP